MTELIRGHVDIDGPREVLWGLLEDPDALARILPGAESVRAPEPGLFVGVLRVKIQFLTIRADFEARVMEADPPNHLRLAIRGRPRGLAGSFQASIPIAMSPAPGEPAGRARTSIDYGIDLLTSGRLATFGAPLLRDVAERLVAEAVGNAEQVVAERLTARQVVPEGG